MLDITTELKALKLHGMADAWAELMDQSPSSAENSKLLFEHMLRAEHTERAMRSVRNQLIAAKFPIHRDLARFDFNASKVDQKLVEQLATLEFTDKAQNAVLIGGPGTGKTHLATAIAVSGIASKGKRVRFYSTVDLVNVLEREKQDGKSGRIAHALMKMDLVILDELGYLPFSQAGGALLFHLLSKLYEHTSVIITTNLSFSEWSSYVTKNGKSELQKPVLGTLIHSCCSKIRQPVLGQYSIGTLGQYSVGINTHGFPPQNSPPRAADISLTIRQLVQHRRYRLGQKRDEDYFSENQGSPDSLLKSAYPN